MMLLGSSIVYLTINDGWNGRDKGFTSLMEEDSRNEIWLCNRLDELGKFPSSKSM